MIIGKEHKHMKEILDPNPKSILANDLSMQIADAETEEDIDEAEDAVTSAQEDSDITTEDWSSLMDEIDAKRNEIKKEN